MPYIEGKPLSEAIARGQAVPEAQAAALARKLALALQEAHDQGVIHRDLKPGNIMVNRRGDLVIMDFGLARIAGGDDGPITRTGHVLGTALYMAPEQAAGDADAVGPAADVYSLGVILHELLTGRRPFEGPWSLVIGLKNVKDPEPPSRHRPDLDPGAGRHLPEGHRPEAGGPLSDDGRVRRGPGRLPRGTGRPVPLQAFRGVSWGRRGDVRARGSPPGLSEARSGRRQAPPRRLSRDRARIIAAAPAGFLALILPSPS